nr:hypothetical protein [Anaerolineae bacterium]
MSDDLRDLARRLYRLTPEQREELPEVHRALLDLAEREGYPLVTDDPETVAEFRQRLCPAEDAASYYGISDRQLRTWIHRRVVPAYRSMGDDGLVVWLVYRYPFLRPGAVDWQETARELLDHWGAALAGMIAPRVQQRTVKAWAKGREV